jgi:hypothetical protein
LPLKVWFEDLQYPRHLGDFRITYSPPAKLSLLLSQIAGSLCAEA